MYLHFFSNISLHYLIIEDFISVHLLTLKLCLTNPKHNKMRFEFSLRLRTLDKSTCWDVSKNSHCSIYERLYFERMFVLPPNILLWILKQFLNCYFVINETYSLCQIYQQIGLRRGRERILDHRVLKVMTKQIFRDFLCVYD